MWLTMTWAVRFRMAFVIPGSFAPLPESGDRIAGLTEACTPTLWPPPQISSSLKEPRRRGCGCGCGQRDQRGARCGQATSAKRMLKTGGRQ